MSARARFAAAIRRVGAGAVLARRGERAVFPASIQPRPRAEEPGGDVLGLGGPERHVMYAPWDCGARQGDRVECGGESFCVQSAETVRLAGEAVYCRAVLRRETGGEPDGEEA